MKKCSLACFAFVAVLLLSACGGSKEDGPIIPAPTISLDGSSNIDTQEYFEDKAVPIKIDAPGKIASFTISVKAPDVIYYGVLNNMIGIAENKYSSNVKEPVLDLIKDDKVAGEMTRLSIPSGASLSGKTTATVDVRKILSSFINSGNPETGDEFTFTFTVSDENEKSLKKAVTFHYTSGPLFTLNPDKAAYDLETDADKNLKITIDVAGKLKGAKIQVTSTNTVFLSMIDAMIGVEANKTNHILDIVNDPVAVSGVKNFGIPTGTEIKGQTLIKDVSLLQLLSTLAATSASGSSHSFKLIISDENEREKAQTVVFSKKKYSCVRAQSPDASINRSIRSDSMHCGWIFSWFSAVSGTIARHSGRAAARARTAIGSGRETRTKALSSGGSRSRYPDQTSRGARLSCAPVATARTEPQRAAECSSDRLSRAGAVNIRISAGRSGL